MNISTKGRYGLRALIDLACHSRGEPVLMGAISKRQGISRKYLHALLTRLKGAGTVRSVRGAGGGYLLAKEPGEITLFEVLKALEGSLSVVNCADEVDSCSLTEACVTREVWRTLNRRIESYLTQTTLEDLIRMRERRGAEAPMYYI